MAYTAAGDVIDKADIISAFTTQVRNKIATHPVWYSGSSHPGWGFPTGWLGAKDPSGPSTGNLTNSAEASNVVGFMADWCYEYTKVRKLRFQRTGNVSPYDSTQVAHLDGNSSARMINFHTDATNYAPSYEVRSGGVIDASDFNAYVDRLYTRWIDYKNVVYTYSVNYCHNSCHQSCHNSFRFRR